MTGYRNINSIVNDATICITFADTNRPVKYSGIPQISDEVSLDTDEGYSMMVVVIWISEDKETLRGKVIHGYYPIGESGQIDIGALVEFSRKKIKGIHKG